MPLTAALSCGWRSWPLKLPAIKASAAGRTRRQPAIPSSQRRCEDKSRAKNAKAPLPWAAGLLPGAKDPQAQNANRRANCMVRASR